MRSSYAKFLMDKTRQDYNDIAEEFSATRKTMWPELADLDKYVKEGDRVLDIGCGNGKLFSYFTAVNKKFSYFGIDVSEKLIEFAKSLAQKAIYENENKLSLAEFKVFDGMNIPYAGPLAGGFDVVYCLAVLPHLPGCEMQVKFLENIRKVSKPGAILILTCWNLWQFKFIKYQVKMIVNCIIDKILGKGECDWGDFYIPWKKRGVEPIYRYYHAFTVSELNSILVKAGWEVEEIGYRERGKNRRFNLCAIAVNNK